MISVSLSPNTEKDDVCLALKQLFSFNKKKGRDIEKMELRLKNLLGMKYCYSFNSGRSSLMVILKALGIKEGDEIIMQAFTCNAAVNPIIKAGAKPVFIDIDKTLNIDIEKIEEKITSQTKAIIIQHTFGYPAQNVSDICKKHGLFLIEDCAHSLGASIDGKYCGTFGDIAFFSFGRDKVISSVYGGAVVTNNQSLAEKIEEQAIGYPECNWINQQLLHPILMNVLVLPLYNVFKIGRVFLSLFINAGLLSKAVTRQENKAETPSYFPLKMPNALAGLAINQLDKLERFNKHRIEIAEYYYKNVGGSLQDGAIYMKYPILIDNPREMINKLKKKGIFLDDGWNTSPIMPPKTELDRFCYVLGSCPHAEETAKRILVLPTHINIGMDDAKKIVRCLTEE